MKITEHAVFGAGCFWGVEEAFRTLPGVRQTEVGYAGGEVENPTYKQVCSGDTGHAEVVHIEFDSEQVSYTELLDVFWQCHNPTQMNRQGPDIGYQYRSVIFVMNEGQMELAEQSKSAFAESGAYEKPIATSIEDYRNYYPAEEYHQQYFLKNGGGACHF